MADGPNALISPESSHDLDETLRATLGPSSFVRVNDLHEASDLKATLPINRPARLLNASDETERISNPRFVVSTVLGEGMSGRVWSAVDVDLGREVAIKHFNHKHGVDSVSLARELQTLTRVNHPRVPTVYDVDIAQDETPYIVMEQVRGRTLGAWIDDLKAGDESAHAYATFYRRIDWIRQLLKLLVVVHQSGLIHRDIKPDNIIISPDGELYLIDWGLAIDLKDNDGSGILVGTPTFMAPEQAREEPLDPRADIYAVGAVAYELLGLVEKQPPGKSIIDHLRTLQTHEITNLYRVISPLQGLVPIEYVYPVMKSLAIDKTQRQASADEFLIELDNAVSGCFKIVCPRTLMKGTLNRLADWIDQDYKALTFGYGALIAITVCAGYGLYSLLGY